MSEILKAIILGIIQGLTEFLPVSSSGHLELMKYFLQTNFTASESLLFTVVLHFATALSTVVVFRKEIARYIAAIFDSTKKEERKYVFYIVVSMIPAVLAGILLESQIEWLFDENVVLVSIMLLITGGLLLIADQPWRNGEKAMDLMRSVLSGIAQALAILPGISRSGVTISTSLMMGVKRKDAAQFSFLMVIPLIFGKIAKDLMDGTIWDQNISWISLLAGFICAFLTGVIACRLMIKLVRESRIRYFGLYCIGMGLFVIVYLLLFENN